MQLAECHPERKVRSRNMCRPCYEKWIRKENPELLAKQQENSRQWKLKNIEKAKASNKASLVKRSKKDPLYRRNKSLESKYGINHFDYLAIVEQQGGGCAICTRKATANKHLHVDHCHTTGKVRGVLCHQCNWFMGNIDADKTILQKLINYINKDK